MNEYLQECCYHLIKLGVTDVEYMKKAAIIYPALSTAEKEALKEIDEDKYLKLEALSAQGGYVRIEDVSAKMVDYCKRAKESQRMLIEAVLERVEVG